MPGKLSRVSSVTNYVQAILPRSGLGHALECYSRAFTYYASGAAEFVHPTWFRIRIGPYLRGEMDKRRYHRVIRTPRDWGLPPYVACRRLVSRVVNEAEFDPRDDGQYLVVRDEGPHDFGRIQPYKDRFVQALHSISRIPVRPRLIAPSVGIFHRSGDFRGLRPKHGDERARRTHGYGYIPPEYAADALAKVRSVLGWNIPAVLSTDGDAREIACILGLGNVTLARTDSALTNLLEMSRHEVLITGTSSYGLWSWFLGGAFAVTPRVAGVTHNLLELQDLQSAWFVFENETSLDESAVADQLRRCLTAPGVG